MRRRLFLTTIVGSTAAGTAGCLDSISSSLSSDSVSDKEITSLRAESNQDDITVSASTEHQFTEELPGIFTFEMTNHEIKRTFVFPGYEIPEFGSLVHAEEGAILRTLSTDHFEVAPPEAPTEGCWMYDLIPPRPASFAPTTLWPGEGVTAAFSLSAMPESDDARVPCLPVGRYSGTSEIDYTEDSDWEDDIDGTVTLTLELTLDDV